MEPCRSDEDVRFVGLFVKLKRYVVCQSQSVGGSDCTQINEENMSATLGTNM